MLLLSLSISHLVTMQFSLPSVTSFFCAFQSSMGFSLFSFLQLQQMCFFSYIQSNLHQFYLCLSLHSVSSMKEMSLSWSRSVLEMLPSAVPSLELLWFAFSSSSSASFLLGWVFMLYFLSVWTTRRSILR